MCPLYPFHVIILYLCLLLPLLLAIVEGSDELANLKLGSNWNLSFNPKKVEKLQEYNTTQVQLSCQGCQLPSNHDPGDLRLALVAEDPGIASIYHQNGNVELVTPASVEKLKHRKKEIVLNFSDMKLTANNGWSVMFNVSGHFLGFTKIHAEVSSAKDDDSFATATAKLPVAVVRKKTIQSKLFAYSVALLVSLAYVNMGCALDIDVIKATVKRPVGPAIGFVCQFLLMPLIAFGLGFIFPSNSSAMRLGLFVTGASPGGGASNIWTVMFGGNLDLSLTMTAISTFAAFFMMPLWIFTLGATIFDDADIVIPYYKICIYAFCLVVPLSIGLALQRFCPKLSKFLVKILKPMALFLILFIIIFGIWANLYIFKLMSWQVVVTGMGLPWLGFLFGYIMATACRRPVEDIIAIAIETGVQNTGMSIFILWFTLDQPEGDMTAVIPVAAATMTPFPLLFALCILKIKSCMAKTSPASSSSNSVDHLNGEDVKESMSKQKLMISHVGDANDNVA